MNKKELAGRITACVCFTIVAILTVSCLSFDAKDAPGAAVYPPHDPAANLCGPFGATVSHYLFTHIGYGVYALLLMLAVASAMYAFRGRLTDKWLRATGALLLVTVISTIIAIAQGDGPRDLPEGGAGVLGVATARFLTPRVGIVGTWLMLLATMAVGLLLSADEAVIAVPKWIAKRVRRRREAAVLAEQVEVATLAAGETVEEVVEKPRRRRRRKSSAEKAAAVVEEEVLEAVEVDELTEPVFRGPTSPRKMLKAPALPRPTPPPESEPSLEDYKLPGIDLLEPAEHKYEAEQEQLVREKARILTETLTEFGVEARVVQIETGPVVTQYEMELGKGVKVGKLVTLQNDIAIALKAPAVRVVAPIPGKNTVGVEVPNIEKDAVRIRELVEMAGSQVSRYTLPIFLGKDAGGNPLVADLASMPHMLLAGTTGSGKSVCINAIIMSILLTQRPDHVKLILIDPKMVEMAHFRDLPHLMCPIVSDMRKAEQILEWAVTKMDERYELLAEAGVRDIASYNALGREEIIRRFNPTTPDEEAKIPKFLPYNVIIVDELADLMMTAKEVEAHITRLAQKSRAVGIHLVLATQRPSVDVITGLIKANMPARISFRVASRIDSRTILDQNGAEGLLGRGDMLYLQPGNAKVIRAQGAYVEDTEMHRVLKFLKEEAEPNFNRELTQLGTPGVKTGERDDLFEDAVRACLEVQRGSVSLLQRRLTIGYGRASRIVDQMAEAGIVGPYKGSQARECLLTLEDWEGIQSQSAANAATAADEANTAFEQTSAPFDVDDDDGVPDDIPGDDLSGGY